jgi:CheY-like chemotaxis protein
MNTFFESPFQKIVVMPVQNPTKPSAIGEIKLRPQPKSQPLFAITSAPDQMNSPYHILVVDDDGDTRQLSVDVLTGYGYEVEAAKDGAAGWDALQTKTYDLVITDNAMPKMTGIEMLEKLCYARMPTLTIMATRSLPMDEFARKPWLRPDAVLQKPFSNDDLIATVKNVLRTDDGNDSCTGTILPKHL